ncbi:hypothetical protein RJ640_013855 [Escallonia rubra]|uniref:RNase H type-1 domain-containing protein n=1 Tax=Escallonia rubra TaxID=112253 RepID=A0AA88RUP7_9ASTE|nr:hypothetical protein RJ640_013855 [Escallonia rubra]
MTHSLALKVGALAHLPTSTSLLTIYSRAGDFSSSKALFGEIYAKDVVIWNAMITAAIDNQYCLDAMSFFNEMIKEGKGFDSATLVIVISALSKMKKLTQCRALHGLSVKSGLLSGSFLCNALIDMYAKCGDLSSSECMFGGMDCRDLVSWNSVMSGCLYNQSPDKSLWYFKQMACCKEQADYVSLSCAISASACLRELCIGQIVHGVGIKLGYLEFHMSVSNSLLSLYSQCGDIDAAENLFAGMFWKDVISWNAMIDGFVLNGKVREAFDLLHYMQSSRSVQPDIVTVVTIIPLCAEFMLLREGKSVHGFTIRREAGLELSVMNSLMDMYMKCKRVNPAELLFQVMPERDLISWNTVISGYSQNGMSREAQILFKKLLFSGSQCSLSTLLGILPSCRSSSSLNFGRSIHCWQLKLGFSNNILAVNSLMFMYINCGDLTASFSLLQRISLVADTDCWNTIISGCTQNGFFLEALEAFDFMRRKSHVTPDSVTLTNVLSACGNLEFGWEGKLFHGIALKTLLDKDTRVQNALITMYGRLGDTESATSVFSFCSSRNLCSWNCMISALSQNKDPKGALELFSCIDFEPNEVTIATILSACTQLGAIRHGKQIHGLVFRSGFHTNSFITAALLDMYSNCGRLDIAIRLFQFLPEKSVAAWNSMISAYGFHSNGLKAVEVFNQMIDSGSNPTKTTFINLLSACSHSGLVKEGLWCYEHMPDKYGVQPVTEHHVCIVDMLGRSGKLSEAYEFIKQIPTQPEAGVWGALLSACNYHGDIEMGREVANILFSLEPENVAYYVSLCNMYIAAGRWSDAVGLRNIIQDKRLKKPAVQLGCRSHPRPGVAQYALQVDAAWKPNDVEAGIAVVILQDGIQVNTWKGRRMASYAQNAEAIAILEAVKWARNNAHPNIIVLSDCSSFIRKLILAGEDNTS